MRNIMSSLDHLQCPVCGRFVSILPAHTPPRSSSSLSSSRKGVVESAPDLETHRALDAHVSRCLRQQRHRVEKETAPSYVDEDEYEVDSVSDQEFPLPKHPHRSTRTPSSSSSGARRKKARREGDASYSSSARNPGGLLNDNNCDQMDDSSYRSPLDTGASFVRGDVGHDGGSSSCGSMLFSDDDSGSEWSDPSGSESISISDDVEGGGWAEDGLEAEDLELMNDDIASVGPSIPGDKGWRSSCSTKIKEEKPLKMGDRSGSRRSFVRPSRFRLVRDDMEDRLYRGRLRALMKRSRSTDVAHSTKGSISSDKIEHMDYPSNSGVGSGDVVTTLFGSVVQAASWSDLFDHQKRGCEWLWRLYKDRTGGILADEMGLGKTAQLSVHFSSVAADHLSAIDAGSTFNSSGRPVSSIDASAPLFLVVSPPTVLRHWVRELHRWAPKLRVFVLHAISSVFSKMNLNNIRDVTHVVRTTSSLAHSPFGLVILVTYEGLRNYRQALLQVPWASVCLDEGQKVRNPEAETAAVAKMLPCEHRLLLSGTPIQNNLKELWSLFDFIYPGRLGTLAAFETDFSDVIRAGSYRGASSTQLERATRAATKLQAIIRPFLLRRRKEDADVSINLPKKSEHVLFCRLSPLQRKIYREIIESPEVERAVRYKKPLFSVITTLRKLCNHPMMAYQKGRVVWHDFSTPTEDGLANEGVQGSGAVSADGMKVPALAPNTSARSGTLSEQRLLSTEDLNWEDSGKLVVLSQVLPDWHREGHKVLLFSQTQSMLNTVEELLKQLKCNYLRLDGSTPINRRGGLIDQFNDKNGDVFAMLLTTRAGGLGISLTGANRVILLDPDWNPQTDLQARERAWRIGQEREVTIYRLITKGTIEEKIYNKQISKLLLTEKVLIDPRQNRLQFSKGDIRDLFEMPEDCMVQPVLSLHASGHCSIRDEEMGARADEERVGASNFRSKGESIKNRNEIEDEFKEFITGMRLDNLSDEAKEQQIVRALISGASISGTVDYDRVGLAGPDVPNAFAGPATVPGGGIVSTHSTHTGTSGRGEVIQTAARAPASAALLSSLRSLQSQGSVSTAAATQRPAPNAPQRANTPANVVSRLKNLFSDPTVSYSTDGILRQFRDLDDNYASTFREILRSIAVCSNGRWRKREQVA